MEVVVRVRGDRPLGERVELVVGLAQVPDAEHEDHHELREGQAVADGQTLVDGLAHEVGRVRAQQDEAQVPGQEEDRARDHEAPAPVHELLEFGRSLDRLPVDSWLVGHGLLLSPASERRSATVYPGYTVRSWRIAQGSIGSMNGGCGATNGARSAGRRPMLGGEGGAERGRRPGGRAGDGAGRVAGGRLAADPAAARARSGRRGDAARGARRDRDPAPPAPAG